MAKNLAALAAADEPLELRYPGEGNGAARRWGEPIVVAASQPEETFGATDGIGDDDDYFVDELKPGTRLLQGQYTIIRYLNAGGFGITYLARDSLDRSVVIKECFPGAFCRRSKSNVRARSRAHHDEFRSVVRLFVQEARNLSKLIHPNIVGVHQVFEDNDTAYMAIDYIDGRELLDLINDRTTLNPEMVVTYLRQLLAAVGFIHDSGVLHRDISPDNILINSRNQPILIDFGAAREQAAKTSRALSALRVVKDGYSPQEFYIAGSTQGPSSDLYALAATFYHAISGEAPPNSQRRLAAIADDTEDPYQPLAGRFPGYPVGFLQAIDKAVSVLPKDRIKSAHDWLAIIDEGLRVAAANRDAGRVSEIESAVSQLVTTSPFSRPLALVPTDAPIPFPVSGPVRGVIPADLPAAVELLPARRGSHVVLVLATVIALAAGLFYAWMQRTAPVPTVAPEAIVAVDPQPDLMPAPAVPDAPVVAAVQDRALTVPDVAADLAPASPPDAGPSTVAIMAPSTVPATAPTMPPAAAVLRAVLAGSVDPPARAGTLASAAMLVSFAAPDPPPVAVPVAVPVMVTGSVAAAAAVPARAEVAATLVALPVPPAPVRLEQVRDARWQTDLPFETVVDRSGSQPFPVISGLLSEPGSAAGREWLREGVTIYAVNDVWVADHAAIESQVAALAGESTDGLIRLTLRIRTEANGPYEHVTLTLPTERRVTLANGTVLTSAPVNGAWQTVVAEVAVTEEAGLEPGDILVAERTSGQSLSGAQSLETIVDLLAREGRDDAIFAVRRDSSLELARMGLSRD